MCGGGGGGVACSVAYGVAYRLVWCGLSSRMVWPMVWHMVWPVVWHMVWLVVRAKKKHMGKHEQTNHKPHHTSNHKPHHTSNHRQTTSHTIGHILGVSLVVLPPGRSPFARMPVGIRRKARGDGSNPER